MSTNRHSGLTLIELIIFIVIVSVALVGVMTVLNITARYSADPMIRKQSLAVAEAVLEEAMLQAFTWCDPNDPQAATATSSAVGATGCTDAASVENIGRETYGGGIDTRLSTTFPLDNVSDYDSLTIATGAGGSAMPSGYSAVVSVAQSALNGIAATESLLITVTVSGPGESIQVQGYRTRHSPNMLP
ncbi:MAG: type II secretion system GspH family protein [Sulfuritalea sp.]|nr:type II secretion system GspH family protein [Sulfuritalea sp.]